MRQIFLIIGILFTAPSSPAERTSQDASKEKKTRELLRVTCAEKNVDRYLPEILGGLARLPGLPRGFKERFTRRYKERLGELIDLLVPIYMKHLEADEIDAALAFFNSAAGKKWLETQRGIAAEAMAVSAKWGMDLGKAVAKELEEEKNRSTKSKVIVDPETAAFLDRKEAREYTLEGEGVRRLSCTGSVVAMQPGGTTIEAKFRYEWDSRANDRKGTFRFQDPAKETRIKELNLYPQLDSYIRRSCWREEYAGARLISEKSEGKTTIRFVEGKSEAGLRAFTLDDRELPLEAELESGPGSPPAMLRVWLTLFDGKYTLKKSTISVEDRALVELTCECSLAAGKFHVPARIVTTILVPGKEATGVCTLEGWNLETGPGSGDEKPAAEAPER